MSNRQFTKEVSAGLRCIHERRWEDDCSTCGRRGRGDESIRATLEREHDTLAAQVVALREALTVNIHDLSTASIARDQQSFYNVMDRIDARTERALRDLDPAVTAIQAIVQAAREWAWAQKQSAGTWHDLDTLGERRKKTKADLLAACAKEPKL
jgi:hypothetical protein